MGRVFPADGGTEQLAQGIDAELFFGPRAIRLHCFQTQVQVIRNLRGRQALAK